MWRQRRVRGPKAMHPWPSRSIAMGRLSISSTQCRCAQQRQMWRQRRARGPKPMHPWAPRSIATGRLSISSKQCRCAQHRQMWRQRRARGPKPMHPWAPRQHCYQRTHLKIFSPRACSSSGPASTQRSWLAACRRRWVRRAAGRAQALAMEPSASRGARAWRPPPTARQEPRPPERRGRTSTDRSPRCTSSQRMSPGRRSWLRGICRASSDTSRAASTSCSEQMPRSRCPWRSQSGAWRCERRRGGARGKRRQRTTCSGPWSGSGRCSWRRDSAS
mmetsp:Transcript_150394/g.481324  ORF Transcript_150394/g.481324 Transcript_150394/m.481324 type:complete len:275 (+) Transcript_150394:102-926(+)